MNKAKHTIRRVTDMWGNVTSDTYEYRGYTIRRRDEVPAGQYGRWSVWPKLYITDTRARCIAWIDQRIAQLTTAQETA